MRKLIVLLILCSLTLGLVGTVLAQDPATVSPFLTMLGSVPREAAGGMNLISYADYVALVNARPGGYWPQNRLEFDSGRQADDPRHPVLMAALNGLGAGMSNLIQVFQLEGMREAVGFDFFTVHRTLEFGQPPSMGDILQGDFDPAAIGAALTAREFTQEEQDDVTLWCSPAGCTEGLKQNLTERNPADPFGGQLGRKQPLAFVPPDTLLSSASYDVVQAMLASQQSPDEDSILSLPEYRAAAEAITARGTLLQAVIIPPDALFAEPAGKGGVPRYELAVFAHIRDEEDVLTLVGLVYANERLASQATDLLPIHFDAAVSQRVNRPFAEMVAERGGTVSKGQWYVEQDSGYAVALLELRSPVEAPEPDPDADLPGPRASGLIFRLLVQSLYNRDTTWLIPSE